MLTSIVVGDMDDMDDIGEYITQASTSIDLTASPVTTTSPDEITWTQDTVSQGEDRRKPKACTKVSLHEFAS